MIRISKSEFNLLRKGVYKRDNINFNIDGQTYWLSEELFNKIKIKSKNNNVNISELAFSMQEFMNKDIIENGDFTIHLENIRHLKNSQDDIYVICSKNSKRSYESLIEKLEEKLLDFGLKIKNFYFISETFYNRDRDDIVHKKVRLVLQHIIGLKTADTKFTEEEITKYDQVSLYDDDNNTIKLAKGINDVLQFLVNNSELYNFRISNENIDNFIKLMLRMYGGELFTDLQQISEADLAKNYFVPISEISTMLDLLQKQNIITYLKQGFLPTITFLTPRYDAKLLPIQERRLRLLKNRELTKANSMINYALATDKCRSNLILQYFNEIPEQGCGACDYCVSQKRKKNFNSLDLENYKNQILILLENIQPINPEALKNTLLPQKEKVFINAIELLLEADRIKYNSNGELFIKK